MATWAQWHSGHEKDRRWRCTWICGPEEELRADVLVRTKLGSGVPPERWVHIDKPNIREVSDALRQGHGLDADYGIVVRNARKLRKWGWLEAWVADIKTQPAWLILECDDYELDKGVAPLTFLMPTSKVAKVRCMPLAEKGRLTWCHQHNERTTPKQATELFDWAFSD